MSEAELFVLHARLQGGILNKAWRGALKLVLPMGLCYTESDTVVLDSNMQVQATIREVFHRFEQTGSAFTTVRHFHQEHLLFPRRVRCGPHQGEIAWGEIEHRDVLRLLHHPAYAGAYVFGRTRSTKTADGKVHIVDVPRSEWFALVKNAHVGYITRVSRYLGLFCAARMQHEGRRVNVRRCSSSRRGDASFTRFHRMTRSRFSLALDASWFDVGLEVSSPPCYTWR